MSKTPASNDEQRGTSSNIAATICRELRGRILSGKLAPGERLPGERELAQRYDTNRNTLREAVRMLEQGRLVSVRHGQGVTVSSSPPASRPAAPSRATSRGCAR
jgi:DNA-binding FadR family transcriptional regulator